jgi:hypothetical protein
MICPICYYQCKRYLDKRRDQGYFICSRHDKDEIKFYFVNIDDFGFFGTSNIFDVLYRKLNGKVVTESNRTDIQEYVSILYKILKQKAFL